MDRVQLATEAKRILDNPALAYLLRQMERETVDDLLIAKPEDDAKRLALTERIRVIREFSGDLARAAKLPSEPKEKSGVV